MWKRNNVQKMIAIALGVMMLTGCAGGEQPTQSVQTGARGSFRKYGESREQWAGFRKRAGDNSVLASGNIAGRYGIYTEMY